MKIRKIGFENVRSGNCFGKCKKRSNNNNRLPCEIDQKRIILRFSAPDIKLVIKTADVRNLVYQDHVSLKIELASTRDDRTKWAREIESERFSLLVVKSQIEPLGRSSEMHSRLLKNIKKRKGVHAG